MKTEGRNLWHIVIGIIRDLVGARPSKKRVHPKSHKHPVAASRARKRKPHVSKSDYKALPKGTVFLVDGANLLGEFKPKLAVPVLRSVFEGLKRMGYGCRIYLEHRSWKYYGYSQASASEGEVFKHTCRDLGVTIVGKEADLAILQTLRVVGRSVALTNDRYADYAKTFRELVGTTRMHGFAVSEVCGELLITVDGLGKAIKVKRAKAVVPTVEKAPAPSCRIRSYSKNAVSGLRGLGNALIEKGNLFGAIRCFEKMVAKHDAEGCAGLSAIYRSRGDETNADKFEWLGERLARRLRDCDRRNRRISSEARRVGAENNYGKCA